MKKFINRKNELGFLENEYKREGSSFVVLYGRRRVGKTALVAEFLKNKQAIYFLATEENETQNRTTFKNIVAEQIGDRQLMNTDVEHWDKIFKLWLDSNIGDEKKLMIIDEFQYLGIANSAFPSIFQKIWDTMLIDKNVMVILCGSLISMMLSQTLMYSSPLYGRRTGQIRLKQIPFHYYHEFFPDKTERELIEYYSITGGVPKYIELFRGFSDVYTAIHENVLSTSAFLYDEPNFLLRREVSEIGTYFTIIKTIAFGNRKLSKIASILEIKEAELAEYLNNLVSSDVLIHESPSTELNPERSKKGLYRIKDNFMEFWFKFVFPNISSIELGNEKSTIKKIRENLVDAHIAYVYEDICIEKMWLLSDDTWDFSFDRAGRWWNGDTEIDIVAFDSGGNNIIFGECKYWTKKIGLDVLNGLEQKAKQVDWKKNERKNHFILFGISGFTDELVKLSNERNDLILMS